MMTVKQINHIGISAMLGWAFFVVVLAFALALADIQHTKAEVKVWEQYKLDHECKVVRKVSDKPGLKITLCWKCDDGVEYCR